MFDQAFSLAQCLGYLAFALGVGSFLQHDDRRFKLWMAAECIVYCLHFALLGVPSAAASSAVSTARSLLALYTRSVWVVAAVIAVNLTLASQLVQHWYDGLPLLASCTGTIGLLLFQGITMRLIMLFGTVLWLLNNVLAGSIGGSALEAVIAIVNLRTIYRLRRSAPGA